MNLILGVIGIGILYSGLSGKKILFISDARIAAILLFLVGVMMCSFGKVGLFVAKAPVHPLTIAGYFLGVIAVFIGIVQIFNLKVPYLSEPKIALLLISAVIIIKTIIAGMVFLLAS